MKSVRFDNTMELKSSPSDSKIEAMNRFMLTRAFSVIESLVVIAIMGALFFVLAPPVLYRVNWLTPPARDVDFQFRDVEHPTAPRLPEKFRTEDTPDN